MPALSQTVLFKPVKVGWLTLQHRVVLAPLTRFRANDNHAHLDMAAEYYAQRGSTPGTLLISEATLVSQKGDAWKKVTKTVHAKGSFIYAQLWTLGRAAHLDDLETEDPSLPYISATAKPLSKPFSRRLPAIPRPLTIEEIKEYVSDYAEAAKNAIDAGFDGVEIHNVNGYLLDQFLQDVSNERSSEYDETIENRARFALEVVKAVTDAVGQDRTGIRFSPWSDFQEMRMKDPVPQFSYLIRAIRDTYPDFAYIHLVEAPHEDVQIPRDPAVNDPFRDIWSPRPFISAMHTVDSAVRAAENKGDIIAFGRIFLANPDLPYRLRKGIRLNPQDFSTFHTHTAEGYTDYPFAEFEETEESPTEN
ncbi:hypothetical protein M422DRAFT_254849 [Sphaerobolus stellatus SS14]|uniref:NADH:flavin oxidoreductase/NADH oxidase N-terminal domain-containing protein n=1 Tax=Sphaerobolus stellatus (strain SS14) TaxID=990650 RepID=A0A0C9VV41_SPHS4|nr:hypothetical protein M422DRAFT_254849 [Sphaerobolus stellatus SS14]